MGDKNILLFGGLIMALKDLMNDYPKWKLVLWKYIMKHHPMWCYTYADYNSFTIRHKILKIKID